MPHLPPATSGSLRERFVADMAVRGHCQLVCSIAALGRIA
jgi:hypothetical protein